MNKTITRLIIALLAISLSCCSVAFASSIVPYADTEFASATVSLYTTKQVSFSCQTYEFKDSISVTSCWLQKKVNGTWTYDCSLTAPSTVGNNTHAYSALMDYSENIGAGTFRVAGRFNADGHAITRYSNERTFSN